MLRRRRNIVLKDWATNQSGASFDPNDYFTHVWNPNTSLNGSALVVSSGDDIVTYTNDKGGSNGSWIGTVSPLGYWGYNNARAIEIPGLNGRIAAHFPNYKDVEYSATGLGTNGHPLHIYVVFYALPSPVGENLIKGANAPNIRDEGAGNNIRIGLNTTDDVVPLTVSTTWQRHRFNIIELQLNGASSRVYLNNVKLGGDVTTNNAYNMTQYFLGSNNNVNAHCKILDCVYTGLFDDATRAIIYAGLSGIVPVGQPANAPYASVCNIDNSGVAGDGIVHFTATEQTYAGSAIVTRNFRIIEAGTGGAPDLGNQSIATGFPVSVGSSSYDFDIVSFYGAPASFTWYRGEWEFIDENGASFLWSTSDQSTSGFNAGFKRDNIR